MNTIFYEYINILNQIIKTKDVIDSEHKQKRILKNGK